MTHQNARRSLLLTSLFLLSSLLMLLGPVPAVSGATSNGTISSDEIWSGGHSVTGDIVVGPGVKLTIQPGTTVTFSNGTSLVVYGDLCAGDVACGASSTASNSSRINLQWTDAVNLSARGECYGLYNNFWNSDPSCNEGVYLSNSIDIGKTKLNHVTFTNTYGIPIYVPEIQKFRYGALVLDGASPILEGLKFTGVNTSSLLALDLATPDILGGEFVVGDDAEEVAGSAIQIYGAGSTVSPLSISNAIFIGSAKGCGQQDGGRHVLWAEEAFVDIDHPVINSGDFGMRLDDSAGVLQSGTFQTTCNAIDVNGHKIVSGADYQLSILNTSIITNEKAGVTAYDDSFLDFGGNVISGASDGSGVIVKNSIVNAHHNVIGPIGGWNGFWMFGSFDVRIENNTITQTAKDPIVAGGYHFGDSGWSIDAPQPSRAHIANNTIEWSGGACQSTKVWKGRGLAADPDGNFQCSAVHAFRSAVTMKNNRVVSSGSGDIDAIRAVGALLDIEDNVFETTGVGARIIESENGAGVARDYGSNAFFARNTWLNVSQTYNVTKSSVTVQSETIPPAPASSNATSPVGLSWPDTEPYDANWDGIVLAPKMLACSTCTNMTPLDLPIANEITNNSTVFTFADLGAFSTDDIYIHSSPSKWSVQVREAELVQLRTVVNNVRVGGASILIEDAMGNDLYDLTTDYTGLTPWFALPSDFHLDFRGLGANDDDPDNRANSPLENSCSDGKDNDGDLLTDIDDSDCDGTSASREYSKYYYTAYRFGKGYERGSMLMDGSIASWPYPIHLENLEPTVQVTQQDLVSMKRVVHFSGSAFDGIGGQWFDSDLEAQWSQKGVVHRVEVKDPFTSDWIDASYATDLSGAMGMVTKDNHPYSDWEYDFHMEDQVARDYTFEFRAYDGVDYSDVITRVIKLNTQPPVITTITSPGDGTTHKTGIVHFSGQASDDYVGITGSDIDKIWFEIEGPNFYTKTGSTGGESWSWDWDVSGMPRTMDTYTIKIWASDSDFCRGSVGECTPRVLSIIVDNRNSRPNIQLLTPEDDETMTVGTDTAITGRAADSDGQVTLVEIEILDPQSGFLKLPSGPHSIVTNIGANGLWQTAWDSSQLVHNQRYILKARSFDGFNYSDWAEIEITAHNPPNAGNLPPTFNATGWETSFTLFCESDSTRSDRCTKIEIDLKKHFSDPDGDALTFYVRDDDQMARDDDHMLVIKIGLEDGIATFDPIDMSYLGYNDVSNWSLENVIIIARDSSGGIELSLDIDFNVQSVSFLVQQNETNSGIADKDELVMFSGRGRSGKSVTALFGGTTINSTVVGSDGSWSLGIPTSRLTAGGNTIEFEYGGSKVEGQAQSVTVEGADESGGFGAIAWVIIIIVVSALLIAVFVFFFVEFEDIDEEAEQAAAAASEEADPYAWAKARAPEIGQAATQVAAPAGAVSAPQVTTAQTISHQVQQPEVTQAQVTGYPGWRWDQGTQQWVPDNESQGGA